MVAILQNIVNYQHVSWAVFVGCSATCCLEYRLLGICSERDARQSGACLLGEGCIQLGGLWRWRLRLSHLHDIGEGICLMPAGWMR
jgi:hypothetical protein